MLTIYDKFPDFSLTGVVANDPEQAFFHFIIMQRKTKTGLQ